MNSDGQEQQGQVRCQKVNRLSIKVNADHFGAGVNNRDSKSLTH